MNDTDSLLVLLAEAMHKEGVVMSDVGAVEARIATLLGKARREARAESMLPLIGAVIAAERMNCTRQTIYNLAKRQRAKVKGNAIALTGT
jgi:hypothetical protein